MPDHITLEQAREALMAAESILLECSSDYNHPNFTDRHQTGPRITRVLAKVRAALAAAPEGPRRCPACDGLLTTSGVCVKCHASFGPALPAADVLELLAASKTASEEATKAVEAAIEATARLRETTEKYSASIQQWINEEKV